MRIAIKSSKRYRRYWQEIPFYQLKWQQRLSVQKNDAIVSNARLTERQQGILDLLVAGFRNKEIAEKIFVSERTVKNELTQIYNQFGVSSRSEAVAFAFKYGLVNE
ncbi:response regulator transcription factor [Fructobacillus fructosus]|uniref:response regulator transcription factor n=1 Tax=Fructobacillus fructosus TaxID=1631 RepID=UPI0040334353